MALLAVFGFLCTLPLMIKGGADTQTIVDRSLDMFTICVPPAIPAALSCGVVFAVGRLKKAKIFCIAPKRVNLAGSVTTMAFDKTGTLTEEGLTVHGFRSACKARREGIDDNDVILFNDFKTNAPEFQPKVNKEDWWTTQKADQIRNLTQTLYLECMASCTSVTYVNGELIGDPLDVKMFHATEW